MKRLRARAVVTITLEIDCLGNWDPTSSCEQVHKQARDEVIGTFQAHQIAIDGVVRGRGATQYPVPARVIGTPIVRQVLVEEEP